MTGAAQGSTERAAECFCPLPTDPWWVAAIPFLQDRGNEIVRFQFRLSNARLHSFLLHWPTVFEG